MQDVCDFCNQHLEANQQAFADPKLTLIYDDAKTQLQQSNGQFDVIIADLADPVYGGPCYQAGSPCTVMHMLLITVLVWTIVIDTAEFHS